ncbi:hypothetical protein GCM10027447_05520 [Glycomyces halotolerans]
MQTVSGSAAVGIDLGTTTATVMVRRGDDRPHLRLVDAGTDHIETDGTAPTALVVPASWDAARRQAHLEAAAHAGFAQAELVPEPEAAARYYTEVAGRELEPGTWLVVYSLGAASCNVGIVGRDGDRFTVHAAADTDAVGGRRFDRALLDHLSAKQRATDRGFWNRVDDPDEVVLRTRVLDLVRRAREQLTDRPAATVSECGIELTVTRLELDRVLAELIARTISLVEQTLDAAGVGPREPLALLLIGGASRTPPVAAMLRERLGVEPLLPDMPELAAAEGAALVAAEAPGPAAPPGGGSDLRPGSLRPFGLLAAILALLFGIATVVTVQLLSEAPSGIDDVGGNSTELRELGPLPEATSEAEATVEATESSPAESAAPDDAAEPATPDGAETATTDPPAPESVPSPSGDSTPTASTPDEEPEESSPTAAAVPDVTGEQLADAERILADAGFINVIEQGYRRTTEGPASEHCEVTEQDPAGGARASHNERITITYSYIGNDTC